MGYCQISDVTSEFPSFQVDLAGDVTSAQIQSWIDQAAARIAAALVQRGFDPDNPPQALTTRQTNLLTGLNVDAAAARLGAILQTRASLQTGEAPVISGGFQTLKQIITDIRNGSYDGFFGIQSRLRDANAYAGADADKTTPEQRGENRAFGMNQDL